jgi:hypothetical protein
MRSTKNGKAVVAFKLLSRDTRGRVEARQLLVPEEVSQAERGEETGVSRGGEGMSGYCYTTSGPPVLEKALSPSLLTSSELNTVRLCFLQAPMAIKLAKAEAAQRLEKLLLKERVLQIDSLTEMGEEHPAPIEYVHNRSLDADGDRQGGGRGQGLGGRSAGRAPSGRSSVQAGRGFGGYALRGNDDRKPVDTLDLDQFLAETNKSEMRAMHSGRPQAGGTSAPGRGGIGRSIYQSILQKSSITSSPLPLSSLTTSYCNVLCYLLAAPGTIAPSGLYVPGGSSNNGNWRERR